MKRISSQLLKAVSICCFLTTSNCPASEQSATFAIIVSNGQIKPEIENRELESIYRRQLLFDRKNNIVIPVNFPALHPLREAFSRYLLDENPHDMQAYWNEQYFHGISPPHVVASAEAMKRFVQATPGAVGYLLMCQTDERVSVLWTMEITLQDEVTNIFCSK